MMEKREKESVPTDVCRMPTNWKKAAREVHKRKKHSEREKTAHVTIFRRNKRIIETTTTT